MERGPINPWSWSIKLGFDQAQLIEGHQRQLVCSGQDAVDADGNPQHPGDMAAQLELALRVPAHRRRVAEAAINTESMAQSWRSRAAKALERQYAAFVAEPVKS